MGCRGTAYVHLWDMPARASPSLTFFDFPFNESFCFFEIGPRFHLGSPCSAHLGDDPLAAVFRRQVTAPPHAPRSSICRQQSTAQPVPRSRPSRRSNRLGCRRGMPDLAGGPLGDTRLTACQMDRVSIGSNTVTVPNPLPPGPFLASTHGSAVAMVYGFGGYQPAQDQLLD